MNFESSPFFDSDFPEEERLPRKFEIEFVRLTTGRYRLLWNGVFIGGTLTKEEYDYDGYRFHDVFHFANAAVMHWSPVFRAMIKRKRKSDPRVDECQDGGRAIVAEEGLTLWIFQHAKEMNFFENCNSLPPHLLDDAVIFVGGLEVDVCPPELWERAILLGYEAFRKVKENDGGLIIGDMNERTLGFKAEHTRTKKF